MTMTTMPGRPAPRRRPGGVPGRPAAGAAFAAVLAAAAGLTAAPASAVGVGPGDARVAADVAALEPAPGRDRGAVQLAQMRRLTPVPPDEAAAGGREPLILRPPPVEPRQQGPAVPVQGAAPPAVGLDDQPRGAGFEVRLGQLEEELRRLTGRIEQVEFEQRRFNERLERLIGDLDARLAAIEARLPGGGGGGEAPPAPPAEGAVGEEGGEDLLARLPAGAGPGPATPRETDAAPPATTGGGLPATGDPITDYHGAMDLLRAGDYAAAEAALDAFLAAHPDHQLSANAAYWLAETRYVREDYAGAAATFARNFRTYGADAPKAPDNLLKLGMALGALGDTAKACQVFDELDEAFPEAPAHIEQAAARERSRAGCS